SWQTRGGRRGRSRVTRCSAVQLQAAAAGSSNSYAGTRHEAGAWTATCSCRSRLAVSVSWPAGHAKRRAGSAQNDNTMSIQFHLIFGVLVTEMALLTIFMLPLPRSWYAAA